MNTDSTQIWFKTQVDISPSGTDDNYDMYYCYAAAENPPCNRSSVYLWYDDFDRTDKPDITTEQAYVKTGGGTWSIESNTLKNVGVSGDPNKLIITALGDVNAAVDMLVKIKVEPPFNGGDTSRMGLSCCMDDPPSRGSGYCALFNEDTNSLDFLNDLRSWGTRGTYGWSLNTWHYMRFRVTDPASRLGQIKLWAVGTDEPSSWGDYNFGDDVARSYGKVGFAGSRAADITYFDDITIRYVADSTPSTALGTEENY